LNLSQIILHAWEMCLLPLAVLNWVRGWRRIRRARKFLLSEPVSFSGILVLLRRADIVDSSLFVLYYREALSAGLLNSLKKQEVCVINVRRDINVAHLSVWKTSAQHGRLNKKSKKKHLALSTADWGSHPALHGKFVAMTWCRLHKNAVGQSLPEDGIRDVTLLRVSTERFWRTVRVSSMSHGSPVKHMSTRMVTLTSKMSDLVTDAFRYVVCDILVLSSALPTEATDM
jgi:hypothetical protein